MKKLLMILIAACLAMPAFAQSTNKQLEKALKKEKKEKLKEYEKDGWKIFGSSRSLEVALLKHYDKLASLGEDGTEVSGTASRCKSKNLGHQMAINDACLTYAQRAGSQLQGRVVSDIAGNSTDTNGEFDHFYAAYERLVEKEIKGEMDESFSVIKDNGDGTFEVQTYFVASESAASKARMRALENAINESEAAKRHAEQISKFAQERVNK